MFQKYFLQFEFFTLLFQLTVQGPCIQGSPSICMGNRLLVMMVTLLHWASLLPECRSPVFTCPICKQFSRPITSIRLSPMSAEKAGKYSTSFICNVLLRDVAILYRSRRIDYFALSSPWIAAVRSTELKLLVLSSLSGRFFRLPRRCRVWCSPQRFEPPWVKGMFSNATPCRDGPCAKSRGVPSHCNRWNARSVTNSIDSIELIDYGFDCMYSGRR